MAENLSELVRTALEKAVQQEGEVRLISKGAGAPGLFPGGPASKNKTDAIQSCFSLDFLAKTREVEEGKGKSAKKSLFVRITQAGMNALFENIGVGRGREILAIVAPGYSKVANDAYLSFAVSHLHKLENDLSSLQRQEGELFSIVQEMIGNRSAFLMQTRSFLENALEETKSISTPTPPPTPAPGPGIPPKRAQKEADLDFQRDQCEQLVFAWQEADGPTKQSLENVMFNLGLEALGERGQVVAFDGREHETQDSVEPGEPIVVSDPGWRLSNSRGVYLISKTIVRREET